jgi:serine/threonine-protein kinase
VLLATALGPNYEVRRLIGRGGFADVFEVRDVGLARRLAAKVLRPDVAWTQGMLARFKEECRVLASLNHSHILPIHFVGEGQGLTYYVMPYVEGHSLGSELRSRGALPVDRALAIAVPVLEALSHAHQAGLLHRDIKPDNVLIDDATGRALLVDFGIAKRVDAGPSHTQTGFVVGTPQYMSPEQALGPGGVDARSDIYSFGATLFQMVTGAPPYDGDSSQEIVGKHLADPVPAPVDRNAAIPRWLSDVIVRCLAKKPGDRFQSVAMVLDAIRVGTSLATVETESAARVSERIAAAEEVTSPARPGRRGKALVLGVAVPVAVLALAVAWVFGRPAALIVTNRFDAPLGLTLPDGRLVSVLPGARERVRLGPPGFARITWVVPALASPAGTPMGEAPAGELALELGRGTTERSIGLGESRVAMFEPLITNASSQRLELIVNQGLDPAIPCGCVVEPGAVRASIGYYPLYRNSTVLARDPAGRTAIFRDLGPQVDRRLWKVGLRFEDRDFR